MSSPSRARHIWTSSSPFAIRQPAKPPIWPGRPLTAHWGVEDPAAVEGTDEQKRAAFMKAFATLQKRLGLLANLRLESLDKLATEQHLRLIGQER